MRSNVVASTCHFLLACLASAPFHYQLELLQSPLLVDRSISHCVSSSRRAASSSRKQHSLALVGSYSAAPSSQSMLLIRQESPIDQRYAQEQDVSTLSQIHTSKGTVVQVQTCTRKVRGQGVTDKNGCSYAKIFLIPYPNLLITIQDNFYPTHMRSKG